MSEIHTSNLLAGIPFATVLIDADQLVVDLNPLAAEMFGAELEGRHYITVLRQPTLLECVQTCFDKQEENRVRFVKPATTHETAYEVVGKPVVLSNGEGVLLSFQDITSFENAGQARRDFVANVSHELRTPLTALAGFIETLLGPAKNDSEAREKFLRIMSNEADRMNRLVGELLELSSVESEERLRPNTEVDVSTLLEASIETLKKLAQVSDININFSPPEEPIRISGDADQLQQVFSNLLENGLKYSAMSSELSVTLEIFEADQHLHNDALHIVFEDQGEGIDPLHIPRLTERFYRVDDHRSREMGGTGLGLAIVKHIVNRHRGRLRIRSTLGKGSEFRVILPIA